MPEKIPLWVVQNTFAPFGQRMIHRLPTLGDDLKVCATCQAELYHVRDWHYCAEKYYCILHIGEARKKQDAIWEAERLERKARWERENSVRDDHDRGSFIHGVYRPPEHGIVPRGVFSVPETEAEVPLGNLEESDYQYWIGCIDHSIPRNVMSSRATCRACNSVVHGSIGRAIHKTESTRFYFGSDKGGPFTCMKVIAMAIRELVHLNNCFVCRKVTNKKHYGVPICSPNCHKIWRFDDKLSYPELDLEISKYWLSTVNIHGTGGSSTSESSSSQTPTVLLPEEEE